MSIVSNLAHVRRIKEQSLQDHAVNACANQIAEFYWTVNWHVNWQVDYSYKHYLWLDEALSTIVAAWHSVNWTEKTRARIFRLAAHKAFGDPMALTQDQLRLRQHATPYYNPENRPIVVEAMGLPDEDGSVIKTVCPGGLINIPYGYQTGGRRSVVNTTAPQLVPMPRIESKSNLLDQTPTTYQEWLTYYPATPSSCCNRSILWSDAKQCLICEICKSPISLIYGGKV